MRNTCNQKPSQNGANYPCYGCYAPRGARRGLSRIEAAAYVGISPSKFDQLIADGRMPTPRRIDHRNVWDVRELDLSFDDLPRDDPNAAGNSWGDR
jgi:predicted DNA-binding transcriptional regulator AlpA